MDSTSIAQAAGTVFAAANISASLAILGGVVTGLAQGNIGAKSIESIARQPEARGSINGAMIISLAMAETNGIYGFVVAMLLLFLNPISQAFVTFVTTYLLG
jgi:F-type H+-transporting ATPase subunit c